MKMRKDSKEMPRDVLHRMYFLEKKSQEEIARFFKCSRRQVGRRMLKMGMRARKTSSVLRGSKFTEEHRRKISKALSGVAKSEEHRRKLAIRFGDKHPSWKGGRRIRNGYAMVYQGVGSGKGTIYVFEHRMVMERMLGRKLLDRENVHHRNGIRTDNRESNLELWVRPQPSGQRVKDLISFVVKNYRAEVLSALEQ